MDLMQPCNKCAGDIIVISQFQIYKDIETPQTGLKWILVFMNIFSLFPDIFWIVFG